jgi:nitrate/nitrite transport system permease protein
VWESGFFFGMSGIAYRLNLSSVFLAVIVIGVTGLILDYLISRLQVLVTHRPAKPGS